MIINRNTPSVGVNQGTNRTQANIKLPSNILTKSEQKMSDEEFEEKIRALAKRDSAAGMFRGYGNSSEYRELIHDYMSVVSPDRQSMINKALPSALRQYKATHHVPLSLEDIILRILMGEDVFSEHAGMSKGQSITLFELRDGNGNLLACLSTNGWTMHSTPAEDARASEFAGIYYDAWQEERFGAEAWHEAKVRAGLIPRGMGGTPYGANSITTVDPSSIQPQQAQATKTVANLYEANLHEAMQ